MRCLSPIRRSLHVDGLSVSGICPITYRYISAFADIQALELVRRLRVGFLTFSPRQPRMSGSLQGDANS
jgi:hypothetical protein